MQEWKQIHAMKDLSRCSFAIAEEVKALSKALNLPDTDDDEDYDEGFEDEDYDWLLCLINCH